MSLVAVLDANVLVPVVSCDFLLTAFDHDLYDPVVTREVLDEVDLNLLENFPGIDPSALRRRAAHMATALEDHTVSGELRPGVNDGVNAKDRHVLAAALAGQAHLVVTNDRALIREIKTLGHPFAPITAASFGVLSMRGTPAPSRR